MEQLFKVNQQNISLLLVRALGSCAGLGGIVHHSAEKKRTSDRPPSHFLGRLYLWIFHISLLPSLSPRPAPLPLHHFSSIPLSSCSGCLPNSAKPKSTFSETIANPKGETATFGLGRQGFHPMYLSMKPSCVC